MRKERRHNYIGGSVLRLNEQMRTFLTTQDYLPRFAARLSCGFVYDPNANLYNDKSESRSICWSYDLRNSRPLHD